MTHVLPQTAAPGRRRLQPLVLLLTALAVLLPTLSTPPAIALDAASSPSSARVAPSKDYPRLPSRCLDGRIIPNRANVCRLRTQGRKAPTLVLWGDSHAWQHIPSLLKVARARKVNLVAILFGGCPPMKVYRRTSGGGFYTGCESSNELAMRWITDQVKKKREIRVLIGSAWSGYRKTYRQLGQPQVNEYEAIMATLQHRGTAPMFNRLKKLKVPTDVIAMGAIVPNPDAPCAAGQEPFACRMLRSQSLFDSAKTRKWLTGMMRGLPKGSHYIDGFNDVVCGTTYCNGRQQGIYTFFDRLHFSVTRSRTFTRFFAPSARALR